MRRIVKSPGGEYQIVSAKTQVAIAGTCGENGQTKETRKGLALPIK